MKLNLSVIAIMTTIGVVKACDLPPNTSAYASKDPTIGEIYCALPGAVQVFIEFAIGEAVPRGGSFMENCFGSILRSLLTFNPDLEKLKCTKGEQKARPLVILENNGELFIDHWQIRNGICISKLCSYDDSNSYLKSLFIEASKLWFPPLGILEDQILVSPKCFRNFYRGRKHTDVCYKKAESCDDIEFLRFSIDSSTDDSTKSFTEPFCRDGCLDGNLPMSYNVWKSIYEMGYGEAICVAEGDILTVERADEEGAFDFESHCTREKEKERTFCEDVPKRRALKKILENNIQ